MTKSQLEIRVKELEAENEALRLQWEKKNTRNAGRKPNITLTEVQRMKKMRAEGKSYAYIGQAFRISATSVYNKLNPPIE